MSTATGRTDRRRRILNEGVRTTDADSLNVSNVASDVNRYSPDEQSASFAIARRILPHRRRSILGVLMIGTVVMMSLLAGHHYQERVVAAVGNSVLSAIDLTSNQSLDRWLTAVMLAGLAGLCLVVFGLRRHRSDDFRGVYRWWFTASLAALATSICVATRVHESLASIAAAQVGWSPLPENMFWWLVPAVLVGGAVILRTMLDLKHCVPALLAVVASLLCGGAMTAAEQGWLPATAQPWLTLISHGCAVGGLLWAVVALLCYCRRIVLEAGGTIKAPLQKPVAKTEPAKTVAAKQSAKSQVKKSTATSTPARKPTAKIAESTTVASHSASRSSAKPAKRAAVEKSSTTQWTDGSDVDSDYGDDGAPRRKLSKAERKRIRKQKERQNRAA